MVNNTVTQLEPYTQPLTLGPEPPVWNTSQGLCLPKSHDRRHNPRFLVSVQAAGRSPISGYSGHVRGLVARNIVGRSFVDTVDEVRSFCAGDPGISRMGPEP